ncbi:5'-nucleotidase domain-containing protein 1-like, partial [Oppia nitens]|uniref:5'-nucleotidase domain-containing protein 1-like n=1 Tax=Oppia nitens TaxID=1686743 RepID=UPI0023D9F9E2
NTFNLNNYNMIAIDMDNTLVKYQLNNSLQLTHTILQDILVDRYGYPADIKQQFQPKFNQKGLVVDKRRGNILKLDANYRVMVAKHGFTDLDAVTIDAIYGTDKVHDELKQMPQRLNMGTIGTDQVFDYYVIRDYFSVPSAQIFAQIVSVTDQLGAELSPVNGNYRRIWLDVYNSIGLMYGNNGLKTSFGENLSASPDTYFIKISDKLQHMLRRLRKNGRLVILITSANVDVMRFMMQYAFGCDDWISCFDLVLTYARKPTFYTTDRPFLAVDHNNVIGNPVDGTDDLCSGQIYSEGNWQTVKTFASKLLAKSEPKCLYIGDSFNDDCMVPNLYAGCDTVGIVEELDESVRPDLDPSYWQSFFGDKQNNNPSLWAKILETHTKLLVPDVECLVEYY